MDLPVNAFKRGLLAGQTQIGLWSHLCSPIATEILSRCGYDWLLLDMEHSPNEMDTILQQLQTIAGYATQAVVRSCASAMRASAACSCSRRISSSSSVLASPARCRASIACKAVVQFAAAFAASASRAVAESNVTSASSTSRMAVRTWFS